MSSSPRRHGTDIVLRSPRTSIPPERIIVADDEKMHTASLAAACSRRLTLYRGARAMIVAAGAGITAGAALYREPPVSQSFPLTDDILWLRRKVEDPFRILATARRGTWCHEHSRAGSNPEPHRLA